jgi:hypothetical protein
MMLQQDGPEDFVLATGETHPVREFVEKSFGVLGIQIRYGSSPNIFALENADVVLQLGRLWRPRGGYRRSERKDRGQGRYRILPSCRSRVCFFSTNRVATY